MKFSWWFNGGLSIWSIMSNMTPSSKIPVRNLQRPPSMTSRTGGCQHTSIHARELQFGTQVKNHIWWRSMMSRMTSSSKYTVSNLQRPPSMPSRGGFLTHFYSCWRTKICRTIQESHIMTIYDVKNDPILQISTQECSISSKYEGQNAYLSAFLNKMGKTSTKLTPQLKCTQRLKWTPWTK